MPEEALVTMMTREWTVGMVDVKVGRGGKSWLRWSPIEGVSEVGWG